jgi:hypothetical protein
MRIKEILEAANAAQQAAIAINMKKHGKKPKKETDEAKQRLDPKCWTGYHKAGTKMKGGIRVNNCVKDESIEEASGHIPKNEKEAHDPRWSNALTVDIGPGEDKKQAAKFGFKVSNSGPPKMRADGKF